MPYEGDVTLHNYYRIKYSYGETTSIYHVVITSETLEGFCARTYQYPGMSECHFFRENIDEIAECSYNEYVENPQPIILGPNSLPSTFSPVVGRYYRLRWSREYLYDYADNYPDQFYYIRVIECTDSHIRGVIDGYDDEDYSNFTRRYIREMTECSYRDYSNHMSPINVTDESIAGENMSIQLPLDMELPPRAVREWGGEFVTERPTLL
jgi:hypothetical protein